MPRESPHFYAIASNRGDLHLVGSDSGGRSPQVASSLPGSSVGVASTAKRFARDAAARIATDDLPPTR